MGLIVHEDDAEVVKLLTMTDRGRLFTAMLDLYNGVEVTTVLPKTKLELVWTKLKSRIVAEKKLYEEKREKCKEASVLGVQARKRRTGRSPDGQPDGNRTLTNNNNKDKEEDKEDIPPTPPEGGKAGLVVWDGLSFVAGSALKKIWAEKFGMDAEQVEKELLKCAEWVARTQAGEVKNANTVVVEWLAREAARLDREAKRAQTAYFDPKNPAGTKRGADSEIEG